MNDWYEKSIIPPFRMPTQGKYKTGYPKGAVIHFTAGNYYAGENNAISSLDEGRKKGYAYLCISAYGHVVQAHPVSEWGYHCGESAFNKVPRALQLYGSVSDDLIGIEMCNAGKLEVRKDKLLTWWGKEINPDEARHVYERDYGCPTGWYHKFSPQQEEALARLLLWLKENDTTGSFSWDHVLGHSEVSGKLELGYWRKSDVGGALSMPMKHFRQYLKDRENYFRTPLGDL